MNDEPVKEGAVLSNFVPILNLMDSNGNQGFSSKRGVVPNKIWNAEKKSWETVNEEYDHDENMINKRIGVIFFPKLVCERRERTQIEHKNLYSI